MPPFKGFADIPVKWVLTFSFLVIILITAILFWFSYRDAGRRVERVIHNKFEKLAETRIQQDLAIAADVLQSATHRVEAMVGDTGLSLRLAQAGKTPAALRAILADYPLDFLLFLDLNGQLIASANHSLSGIDLSYHPIVQACRDQQAIAGIVTESEALLRQEQLAERAQIHPIAHPEGRPLNTTASTTALMLQAAKIIQTSGGQPIGIIWGGHLLNHDPYLVDRIGNLLYQGSITGIASIFQDDIRIATRLTDKQGNRLVGTQIDETIYTTVVLKETPYFGTFQTNRTTYVAGYQPLYDISGHAVGMVGIGIDEMLFRRPQQSIMTAIQQQQWTSFGLGLLIALVIGMFGALWFSKFLSYPIRQLVANTERLAAGDLTTSVGSCGENELGILGKTIQKTIDNLNELVGQLQQASQKINHVVDVLSDEVRRQARSSTEQSTAVTETTSTMEELAVSSKQIAQSTDYVVQIAEKTQEDAQLGVEAMDEMIAQMEEIQNMNERSITEIFELGGRTKRMQAIMNIINDVADRTKLIAFNASLEAEAAGESGKRFRVVATEIRRLADNVTESTEEIRSKIHEIQQATNELVIASEETSKRITQGTETAMKTAYALQNIMHGVEETTSSAKQISLATQQQRTASEQVVQSLREVSTGIGTTVQAIKQTESIVKDLQHLSEQLSQTVDRFKLNPS